MSPCARVGAAVALACASRTGLAGGDVPAVTGASTFGVLLQGLLGLAVVLAALAGFFWFLRRFSPGQTGAQGVVKVVGGVMLGPRERLVVVEVGGTWLLLGVGGGQVTRLHDMPRPASPPPGAIGQTAAGASGFADRLRELLPKRPG
ncbi:MAG TPA: flagellar biosynthetic protein FliO [Thiobacillaceae bacterium]|nr:flagellar biosynthetic protein FliO [Thiobacillaceae bacterium]HNU64441.1 flagellar biosynthetic protein FliO [Thiobacillaceae bacterium]